MANVYCGFHGMYFPIEPAPAIRPFPGDRDSHGGICPRCRAEYEAERVKAHALTPAEILRGVARDDEVKQ